MDGSSVYKQSGGVEWRTDVVYPRDGEIVYITEDGQKRLSVVARGSQVGGIVSCYAYLDPAPPSEPKLKWHRWSERKPEDGHWLCRIDNTGGTWGSESGDFSSDEDDTVWWAYAPCSSKYGE